MEAALLRVAGPRRVRSCWDNWVFALALRSLRGTGLFFRSLLPSVGGRALSPLEAHRAFVLAYEAEYGGFHPSFAEGALVDALARAKREGRFLLVYLHSSQHGDTDAFCRGTLSSEAVVQFVDRNLVMWAGDVTTTSGYEAALTLRATSFPHLSLLYMQGPQEVRSLGQWIGPLGVDEMLVQLMAAVEENEAALVADRAEVEERERNRVLLRQQNDDYEQSLRADRQKKTTKDKPVSSSSSSSAPTPSAPPPERSAPSAPVSSSKGKEEEIVAPKKTAAALPSEPEAGGPGVVRVAFRLPSQRLERRFRGDEDTIGTVFSFVDQKLEPEQRNYRLVSAYPRAVYQRSQEMRLSEAGFGNAMTLLYEEEEE